MPTLIYTPAVQVVIESCKATDPVTGRQATEEKPVLIDVSNDLVEGTLSRRTDGVSTFMFSMQNARRKYDYIFSPNDRIYVLMKRLTWLRVFTGYLNSVPLFSVWPRVVQLQASCSLKRLQYFYWDATLPASENLVRQSIYAMPGEQDGGIRNVATSLLTNVVNWPRENIHIGQVPSNWFDFAAEIAKDVIQATDASDQLAAQMFNSVNGGADVGGGGSGNNSGAGKGTKAPGKAPMPKTAQHLDASEFNGGVFEPYTGTLPITKASSVGFFTGNVGGIQDPDNRGVNFIFGDKPATLAASKDYYCALHLPFETLPTMSQVTGARGSVPTRDAPDLLNWWKHKRIVVTNPATKRTAVCQIVGTGPGSGYGYGLVLSPAAMKYLTNATDSSAIEFTDAPVAFVADQSTALGPYGDQGNNSSGKQGGSNQDTQPTGTTQFTNATRPGTVSAYDLLAQAIAATKENIPYVYGGGHGGKSQLVTDHPTGLDCSSFIAWIYLHMTGKMIASGYDVNGIVAACGGHRKVSVHVGMNTQSAVLVKKNASGVGYEHIELSCGDGKSTVGEHTTGEVVTVVTSGESYWDEAYLLPSIDYKGAGVGHTTPIPQGGQASNPAGTSDTQQSDFHSLLPSTDVTGNNQMDTIFQNVSWNPVDDGAETARSAALVGIRALLNDQPIFSYIKDLMNSSLRAFCSAPNGDFIAWFPDYYGIWQTAGIMKIKPIELIDFTADWSDDFFVTHQFVTANWSSQFSTADGTLSTLQSDPDVSTVGIASIDIPAVMRALFGESITEGDYKQFREHIYKRFGPRPDYQQPAGIFGPKGEFFYALFLFMRQWAYQYNANVSMTFMPELWPGMLIQIDEFNFQGYVTTVSHSFRFGDGGSFSTTVNIAAPARINDKGGLIGFPTVSPETGLIDRAKQGGSKHHKKAVKAPVVPHGA